MQLLRIYVDRFDQRKKIQTQINGVAKQNIKDGLQSIIIAKKKEKERERKRTLIQTKQRRNVYNDYFT